MANQGLVDAGVVEPVKRYYQWEEEGRRQRQPSSSSYDERRDVNRLTYVWRTWTDRDKSTDRTESREPKLGTGAAGGRILEKDNRVEQASRSHIQGQPGRGGFFFGMRGRRAKQVRKKRKSG